MKISIKPEVFERFNRELKIAFILARDIDNKTNVDKSRHLLSEVEKLIRLNFHNQQLKDNSFIEPWALAQLEFAGKAHHYHTSVERLIRTVLSGKTVAKNDSGNNLWRYISLRYLVPVSADDFDKIAGDLTFDLVRNSGKKGLPKTLKRGELYYYDARGILSTQIDYWKSRRTEISRESLAHLIHVMALPPVSRSSLRSIAVELASLMKAFCGAKTEWFILDKKNNFITV